MARIGVVGAGRVGAVLSAALRAAGHEIVAAGGDSPASLHRIETLLPGVPVAKPTDVARACDLLLLTVPDDMLGNVVTTLVGAGAIREGQVVLHTSRPPRSRRARARDRRRRPADRDAPRHDVHRHRGRPRPPVRLRLRPDRRRRRAGVRREPGRRPRRHPDVGARRASARSTTQVSRTVPTTSSPWSARRWSCSQPPAPRTPPRPCGRCSARPSTTPSPPATPRSPARSCAATSGRSRPTSTTSPTTRRPRSRRTSRWRRPPPTGPCSAAGCCRSAPPAGAHARRGARARRRDQRRGCAPDARRGSRSESR